MEKRYCIECEEPIFGRLDKKFCSDQCRSMYHNKMKSDCTNFMRNVNNILRKNRRILLELNPTGKTKIHQSILSKKGFHFQYFTNEFITKSGNIYRFCYDQGYLQLKDEFVALVVRNNYVH